MLARLAVAVAVGVLAAASPARAFVCSRVLDELNQETGPSLSWPARAVRYTLHADGTTMISGDQELDALRASFAVWEQARLDAQNATDFVFVETALGTRDYVGYDFLNPEHNANLLIFRDDGWLHPGQGCATIALTTTTYSAQTGEIFDADIEFNSACPTQIQFGIDGHPGKMDLMNTAVHEIGHVIGLGHPDVYVVLDPDCATHATMCSSAKTGETEKRDLALDDIRGMVFKYPAGRANGYCAVPACARGLTGCGTCTATDCATWIACGFCAPPVPATSSVAIAVLESDDGGGCSCGASGGGALGLLGLGLLLVMVGKQRARLRGGR